MSAIAEYPHRIRNIFVNKDTNPKGLYAFKMIKNGVLKTVCVDDHLPTEKCQLQFTRNNGAELWAAVMEKAYAKLHGSSYE